MRTGFALIVGLILGVLGGIGASRVGAQTGRPPAILKPDSYVLVPVQQGDDAKVKLIGVTGIRHRGGQTCILITDAGGIATVAAPCPSQQ
jgi:hypothetical protein